MLFFLIDEVEQLLRFGSSGRNSGRRSGTRSVSRETEIRLDIAIIT